MAKSNKEFLHFSFQWVLLRMHWFLSAFYIVVSLVFNWTSFKWVWLVFWFMLGLVITLFVKEWRKWQKETDQTFDLEYDKDESNDSYENIWTLLVAKYRKIIVQLADMPVWIKIHWLIVCGFLGMTFWYMLCGLDLLFVGANDFAIIAFSILVTLSLLWLVVMISSGKKNMMGYIVFYIVFDLFTAFQFNYIHFYDNVSQTQSMERDMNACDFYLGHQRPIISRITERVESDVTSLTAQIDQLDKNSEDYRRNGESIGNNIDNSQNDEVAAQNRKMMLQSYKKASETLRRKDGFMKRKESRVAVQEQLGKIGVLEDSLNHYCTKYQDNKELFTQIDLKRARQYVFDLNENICLLKDTVTKWYGIDVDNENDTVNWALCRLKKNRGDRFEGINKLMDLFKQNNGDEELKDSSSLSESAILLAIDERKFERRLLVQSISLSAVIDLLPLALGIFVALVYKRKED